MIDIKNPHAEILYSLRGKRIYVEIVGSFFHGISDIGIVNAVIQDNSNIEINGYYEDFSLARIGLKIDYNNDLVDKDNKDKFLFKIKFTFSKTSMYFYEYEELEEEE